MGLRVSGLGFRVSGLGFRVWGLGFRVSGFGFRDTSSSEFRFRVLPHCFVLKSFISESSQHHGFRLSGLGLGAWTLGFRV